MLINFTDTRCVNERFIMSFEVINHAEDGTISTSGKPYSIEITYCDGSTELDCGHFTMEAAQNKLKWIAGHK